MLVGRFPGPAFGPAALRRRCVCAMLAAAVVSAVTLPLLRLGGDGRHRPADGGGGASVQRFGPTAAAVGLNATAASPVSYVYFSDPLAGLGNKMFQYASGLGLALRYGKRAVLVADHPFVVAMLDSMAAAFIVSELTRIPRVPPSGVVASVVAEAGWGKYDASVFDDDAAAGAPLHTGGFLLTGHLQSWRYFAPVGDAIRGEFRLTRSYEDAAASFMRRQRLPPSRASVLVGVHVRRGDMLQRPDLYTTAPAAYLRRAVDYYLAKYGGPASVSFLVATDDRPWVERVAAAGDLPPGLTLRYADGLSPARDMALLSRCNHSIITGGTFGWWAAWLAGGDVVYYKDFILPTSKLYASYNETDYYPPHWIGMS